MIDTDFVCHLFVFEKFFFTEIGLMIKWNPGLRPKGQWGFTAGV